MSEFPTGYLILIRNARLVIGIISSVSFVMRFSLHTLYSKSCIIYAFRLLEMLKGSPNTKRLLNVVSVVSLSEN